MQIIYKNRKLIEAKKPKNIAKKDMVSKLGISGQTHVEWLREANKPTANGI